MHPIWFRIGDLPVTAYGVALTLSFVVGIALARWRARSRGVSDEIVVEAAIVIFVTALVGSRLLYALENPELFQPPHGSWLDLARPLLKSGSPGELGGLSMSAGVVLAVASVALFLRVRGVRLFPTLDVLAPSLALGEGITRVGCFLNGCCFGRACEAPWAVRFPAQSPASLALGDVAVHPTQLYASLAGFALAGALLWRARLGATPCAPGAISFATLAGIAASRLVIDVFRHYPQDDRLALGLWLHQPFVIAVLAVGLAGLARIALRSARR